MTVHAPEPLQYPFIAGVGLHVILAIGLALSTLLWKSVYCEGSRMGFAWLMSVVNSAFCVLYALRWMDGETRLRDDSITWFPPREIIHAFTILMSMGAAALYLRYHCLTVGPSIAFEACVGALFILWGASRPWHTIPSSSALSLYLWILGAIALGAAVLQLLAWAFVPDKMHPQGSKTHRRQDLWGMAAVAIACEYLVAYAVMELIGTPYTRMMSMDTPLYEWLHLGLCTLPIGVGLAILGILTYWNDIQLHKSVPPPVADATKAE